MGDQFLKVVLSAENQLKGHVRMPDFAHPYALKPEVLAADTEIGPPAAQTPVLLAGY